MLRIITVRNTTHSPTYNPLLWHAADPLPLMDLARRAIRLAVGKPRLNRISELNIPPSIVDYLNFKERTTWSQFSRTDAERYSAGVFDPKYYLSAYTDRDLNNYLVDRYQQPPPEPVERDYNLTYDDETKKRIANAFRMLDLMYPKTDNF